MDAATHRILHFSFIYRGVISDGLSGLKKALAPIPYQYCQFHQVQRIRQLLTNHPKHPASIALKEISLQVTHSDKEQFTEMLSRWHKQCSGRHTWKRKRIRKMERLSLETHRRLRAAYFGLSRHLDVLYTYQSFPELGLPNTNNALESLNASLKTKLRLHRGISRERKQRLIQSIIMSYNPCSIKGS